MSFFLKLLKWLLKWRGFILVKATSKERVKSLIEKLRPFKTEKQLIRLGPNGDGGYLVPDDLIGVKACFSPGVYKTVQFEEDCLKLGMKVFMADNSVESPELKNHIGQYDFIKKHIGSTLNETFITMDQWVNSVLQDSHEDLLLQMDIEGGEYYSLINMSDRLLGQFRILVIEFHFLEELWNPSFFNVAEVVFNKILQTHTCVHIHPNNSCAIDCQFGIEIPSVAEFTFLRNDRIKHKTNQVNFPHKLDYDNTENKHVKLPSNWHY
jgi:hypothetical protein